MVGPTLPAVPSVRIAKSRQFSIQKAGAFRGPQGLILPPTSGTPPILGGEYLVGRSRGEAPQDLHSEIGQISDCECKDTMKKWGFANFLAKKCIEKCILFIIG